VTNYPNFYGFCWCGKQLIKKPIGIECPKHMDKFHEKPSKIKRGRFSGSSRSENAFGKY